MQVRYWKLKGLCDQIERMLVSFKHFARHNCDQFRLAGYVHRVPEARRGNAGHRFANLSPECVFDDTCNVTAECDLHKGKFTKILKFATESKLWLLDERVDSLRGAPVSDTDELDGGEKVGRILVIAGGDATELLDAVEEAFDEVPLFIEPRREGEALLAVGSIGDVGPDIPGCGRFADGVAVIPLVPQQGCAFGNGLDQRLGLAGIVDLPAGQSEADRASVSVDKSVEFAGEAAPGTSHATIATSPFLPVAPFWWTRMQVESIITNSPLKPAETAARSRSHTPALRQRTNRL